MAADGLDRQGRGRAMQRNWRQAEVTAMRLDSDIKRDVEHALRSDPDLDATDIAVAVTDGGVTLTGFVRSFHQQRLAERDIRRMVEVLGFNDSVAVHLNVEVRLPDVQGLPDADIARAAVEAIEGKLPFSADTVEAAVENGRIALEGQVEWFYQRERAEEAVQDMPGVRGILNRIEVCRHVPLAEMEGRIEQALQQAAEFDARRVSAEGRFTEGGGSEVTLLGAMRRWVEREQGCETQRASSTTA
jgi:osmotically-inducible protein OsmY